MARTKYRNGDPITLSCGCDSCSPIRVNGVLCHEAGCRDAWRDYQVDCRECGFEFYPVHRGERICPDCVAAQSADSETVDVD